MHTYYEKYLDTFMLEGQLELDETQLFKEKKTSACHRSYALKESWVFGIQFQFQSWDSPYRYE